jgi:predicted ATPase
MAVDVLALARRRGEARRLLKEAIERADGTGERWFDAELHRLAGRLALQAVPPDRSGAQACFERALATASSQGAMLWELRAAASLTRLGDQRARDRLAGVYGQFIEGRSMRSLKDSGSLLKAERNAGSKLHLNLNS